MFVAVACDVVVVVVMVAVLVEFVPEVGVSVDGLNLLHVVF